MPSDDASFLHGAYVNLQHSVARLQELVCCAPAWLATPDDAAEFDEDAALIAAVPPLGELAEALIPPSLPSYTAGWGPEEEEEEEQRRRRRRQSSLGGASSGSEGVGGRPGWDAGALRPLPHEGVPVSPHRGARDGGSGKLQGIELKRAEANPLLGQGHLDSSGRFVAPTLAKPQHRPQGAFAQL